MNKLEYLREVPLSYVAEGSADAFVDGPFGSNLKSQEYTKEGIRLIQLQNIGVGEWIDSNKKFISRTKFDSLSRHGALPGDVAVAKMADPVARACLVPRADERYLVVADCIKLRVDNRKADPHFIVNLLNSRGFRAQAERASIGTTRIRINLSKLKGLRVSIPHVRVQRKIANILSTVDEVIRATERVIAKLEQAKQGLLHDLLTCGIDESGRLRDPYRHPDEFTDTLLGRLPRAWSVVHVAEIAEFVTSGSRGWAAYYADDGPLFIRIGNLTRKHINLRLDHKSFVRPPSTAEIQRTAIRSGDVLISITADLGIIGAVPASLGEAYVNQHIALVRPDTKMISGRWIAHFLASPRAQAQFAWLNDAGAKAGLNLPAVGRLLVPVPACRHERELIVSILDHHDETIATHSRSLTKLRLLKQGLMDDLLTGRVRVSVEGVSA